MHHAICRAEENDSLVGGINGKEGSEVNMIEYEIGSSVFQFATLACMRP
jgi:hypothetical protein